MFSVLLASSSLFTPLRPLTTRSDSARCPRPRLALGGNDRAELEELLRSLEGLRDWVSNDVAFAAMQAAREKRSLDAFISELQDEVTGLGEEIAADMELTEMMLDEQSTAFAAERRTAMTERAETLLEELESMAPASFRNREEDATPPEKSPFLPIGAEVAVMGVRAAGGEALLAALRAAGYELRVCSQSVPATCADPTLPASNSLRRELAGADGLVMLCSGAAAESGAGSGGVTPTLLTAASRTPLATRKRLRRPLDHPTHPLTHPRPESRRAAGLAAPRADHRSARRRPHARGGLCAAQRAGRPRPPAGRRAGRRYAMPRALGARFLFAQQIDQYQIRSACCAAALRRPNPMVLCHLLTRPRPTARARTPGQRPPPRPSARSRP